ncbi:glycosyltransferase family 4 protein [Sinomonas sp. JGH33]|uniref:D-inositol 3-phosphate glycosyltransferase n=1 Tax=Sinomonas terricola TaxID=3110330 RepID=A0ABU5T9R7_9MICC|nr:glycosyltransferase family 4 protein [Sinomonas sp. JGH33]MEA5456435.1 glycosyltransferase family 4 protein [Sinomonas sp. JGH33]
MTPAVRLDLVVPAPLAWRSGGSAYNERLADALAAAGVDVRTHPAAGAWPVGSSADRARLRRVFREIADDGGARLLVDGLVGLGCPGEIAEAQRWGLAVWLLVHMPIGEMPDAAGPGSAIEAAALAAASGAITPSHTTAAELARRHGVEAAVARPGVDRSPLSHGSDPPRILCVAALLHGKRQLELFEALGRLADLPWTAELVGSDRPDPDYARAVRDAAAAPPLRGRVRVAGELLGDALEAAWGAADLSVLASASETFGLVVAESLARGVPAIVPAGTGAEEALGLSRRGAAGLADTGSARAELAGAVCRFDDTSGRDAQSAPDAVAVLRSWLTDPALRSQWRAAACAARPRLPGWGATARAVLTALGDT